MPEHHRQGTRDTLPSEWRRATRTGGTARRTIPIADATLLGRRRFMQLMGASLALAGSAGCTRVPLEHIVPYRDGPAEATYAKPVFYASAIARDGYGAGVLVRCNEGRPTKIEGNPDHPASLGATDVFAQASVLELWDPERSRTVMRGNAIDTWDAFASAVGSRVRALQARGGAGLAILTETITSPSVLAQLAALRRRWPELRRVQWQPFNRDAVYEGARLAYGDALEPVYRFDRARCIVSLDADFVDAVPGCVRYAHDFASTRNAFADPAQRSRLYAVEATPSLTGAMADHRIGLRASAAVRVAQALAQRIGAHPGAAADAPVPTTWLDAAAADLQAAPGASIVVAGDRQPAIVHALVHAINERLGNVGSTVMLLSPVADPAPQDRALADLVDEMRAGRIETLLVLGANPVYAAPADLGFADALSRVPVSVHSGVMRDETAARCTWHVPATHVLEAWGDVRAFDGTVSLQQPCIAPLYEGRSAAQMLAFVAGDTRQDARAMLREAWQAQAGGDFERFWATSLRSGVVAGSALEQVRRRLRALPAIETPGTEGIELVFTADPRLGDGRHANNAWLQELPKPITQLTWDNAVLVAPSLARRLGIADEDVVRLNANGRQLDAPVCIVPGQPEDCVALAVGYGRSVCGDVGRGLGVDANRLRSTTSPWLAASVDIEQTGRRHALASAQMHHRMEGRDIVRTVSAAQAAACTIGAAACASEPHQHHPTLYDTAPRGPYAWAMSIDLAACVGCGACTIACQAENNIPVVGKEEVARGREMHWIRVDRYREGSDSNPRTLFQPVPCMQCEHAPCEVVCPVGAAVHDAQGLNVQVYNRCVGTRFCSNNCPYKVRRFNFFGYAKDEPTLDAQRNPEVTVRMRGVMEKCNYCLQRIVTARVEADKAGRRLADGEVVTACQAVCPTRAIAFGDLADADSEVNRRKRSPLDYALLEELNTRPRTTYLARVVNPSPALGSET